MATTILPETFISSCLTERVPQEINMDDLEKQTFLFCIIFLIRRLSSLREKGNRRIRRILFESGEKLR